MCVHTGKDGYLTQAGHRHERFSAHLSFGTQLPRKRVNISLVHFDPRLVVQKAEDASVGYVTRLISAADTQACSLTDADRCVTVDGMYWAVPNVTHLRMTEFAEAKAAEAAMRAGETPTRVSRVV